MEGSGCFRLECSIFQRACLRVVNVLQNLSEKKKTASLCSNGNQGTVCHQLPVDSRRAFQAEGDKCPDRPEWVREEQSLQFAVPAFQGCHRRSGQVGDSKAMREAIRSAFSGAELIIGGASSRFSLSLRIPDLQRPLEAQEFSDGTLRYLCLVAGLLSPHPPSLLALNEPETSLHPDLLQPRARLIAQSFRSSQLWITTHSRALAEHIEAFAGQPRVELKLVEGETRIVGQGLVLPEFD